MMLVPQSTGGSPVISCIMAHNRRASSRRRSSGTRARNAATDAPVGRIAGALVVATRLGPPIRTLFAASVLKQGRAYTVPRQREVRPGRVRHRPFGQGLYDP